MDSGSPKSLEEIENFQLLPCIQVTGLRLRVLKDPYRVWAFGRINRFGSGLPPNSSNQEQRWMAERFTEGFLHADEKCGKGGELSYHDFVTKSDPIQLGLRHTGFAEGLGAFYA